MLLEFSASNYRSIRDTISFSLLAGTDDSHLECSKLFDNHRVLKSAVIYGANGSGKSNFIRAITLVKLLVLSSIQNQPGSGIWQQEPFKLEGYDIPSVFRMQFVINGIRYLYQFSLKQMLVKDEYLYFFPNKKQTKIFERHGMEFSAGRKFRGRFDSCRDVLKPNRLLLSCAANFSSVKEVEDVYKFFRDDLIIFDSDAPNNWLNYSLHMLYSNNHMKEAILAFMKGLGMGIQDFEIKIETKKPSPEEVPSFLAPEFRNKILTSKMDRAQVKVVYSKFKTDLLLEESNGVRKLFAFLCPFLDIVANGKVLICDELETSLHESIVLGILNMFFKININEFPQLIFTTHDTSLLNLNMFRRDQIWFTELKEDRSTDLYSLAEVKNVRKDENIRRGYIRGRYGAIPMLNLDFAKIISKNFKDVRQ